jgi:hypothetical protein
VVTEKLAETPEGLVVAVDAKGARKLREALAPIGELTDLGSKELVLLRPAARHASARAAWSDVLGRMPDAAWAAPILKNSDGKELYPTGSLTVRFRKRPTEPALRTFARKHGLALENRNEFVAEQASFRPLRPREAYLPDLVEKLAGLPEVAAAWASTLSRHRRA